jgi:hypothetical protein
MTTDDPSSTVPAAQSQLGETDEYNTLFTRRLWSRGRDANSTMVEPTAPPILVSSSPSDSSFGFQNTFQVLERQMHSNKYPFKLTANQLEAAKEYFKASEGIPLTTASPFPSIIEEAEEADEDEPPSFLELELEAASRLQQRNDLDPSDQGVDCVDHVDALYGISAVPKEEPKIDDTGEYPEYLYHVARAQNGKLYLRVVRSMLVDSGMSILKSFSMYKREFTMRIIADVPLLFTHSHIRKD